MSPSCFGSVFAARHVKALMCCISQGRVTKPWNCWWTRSSGELLAVLSDINMPGMDGLQLLGEIKQRFPDLPVMMVTAYGDDERRRRADDLGAADFLSKPVDFDRLKGSCGSSRRWRTD